MRYFLLALFLISSSANAAGYVGADQLCYNSPAAAIPSFIRTYPPMIVRSNRPLYLSFSVASANSLLLAYKTRSGATVSNLTLKLPSCSSQGLSADEGNLNWELAVLGSILSLGLGFLVGKS